MPFPLGRQFRPLSLGILFSATLGLAAEAGLQTPPDLAADLVLREPVVAQPVFLNFDERGRMWVVQYRQYPRPAGLTGVSRDNFWRTVYDRKKPAPPYDTPEKAPFRGVDRITIHEDVKGDGSFAKTTTFLDGLNITTAVAHGRGGVWVLSPPHLLFYADANRDDVPDAAPVVHLDGFNLEDTHSVANSLRWGPDGWLYGATGSTVTADIVRPGLDAKPIAHIVGQAIWRYEPSSRRFEVFAEGGGNAFGVEIDAQGRTFSGHNGGDTRGFHYVQGGYLQKGFGKHGELSNPYAFGYFPAIPHERVKRFSHNFLIYDGDALPERYRGRLIGIDPLNGYVPLAELTPRGASFKTRDLDAVIRSDDKTFRPVDIKHGPDGAIYLADWADAQIAHPLNSEGKMSPEDGRIFRVRATNAKPGGPAFDLAKKTSEELIALLRSPNRWQRETAQRVLADRRDAKLVAPLRATLKTARGQFALEALWALHASGGFDEDVARELLAHEEAFVRLWAVRLLGDTQRVADKTGAALAVLAEKEPNVEVRSQLAASAKRLPTAVALPIIRRLFTHEADADDPYVPLQVWWALESKCATDRAAVLAFAGEGESWQRRYARSFVARRLMQRFAAVEDWDACVTLLERAPASARTEMAAGFEAAFSGRALPAVPEKVIAAVLRSGSNSLVLRVRQGDAAALREALTRVLAAKTPKAERLRIVQALGEAPQAEGVPALVTLVGDRDGEVRTAAIASASAYDDARLSRALLANYAQFTGDQKNAAQAALSSRATSAALLLDAVDSGAVEVASLRAETLDQIRLLGDPALATRADRAAPRPKLAVSAATAEIDRLARVVGAGQGDPYRGRVLFEATCAACHAFYGRGGELGPDLTSAKRDDVAALLLAIIRPDAEIREGYDAVVVTTNAGVVRAGFVLARSEERVSLRDLTGLRANFERAEIASLKPLGRSLMPEGLLTGKTDQEVRDLFAYLRITQPLVVPDSRTP